MLNRLAVAFVAWAIFAAAHASPSPGQVVASGAVPDEAAKSAILARLRDLYGAERVVDQISVGGVVSPPNWSAHVQKTLGSHLKSVSKGQLTIDGVMVSVKGEVATEALRQQIAGNLQQSLNHPYVIKNGLRVSASEQDLLNETLANRIVEFESGSATLTSSGAVVLDEMAQAIKRIRDRRVEVIGHTDGKGTRETNLALSQARADSVKTYLVSKGVDVGILDASGMGPDQPIASNATPDGRARNRRIEFRVSKHVGGTH